MTDVDLAARVEVGRQYFALLGASLQGNWQDLYANYLADGRLVLLGLVLIHPVWLEGLAEGQEDIRGPRGFGPASIWLGCQARLIWGYDCNGGPLETDHMFPYGLGGPTRADNGLVLCQEHNRLKGHDVHLIPWEAYGFPWLDDQVARMRARQS